MAIPIEQRLNLKLGQALKVSFMEGDKAITDFDAEVTGLDRKYSYLTKVGVDTTVYRFPRRMIEGRRQIGRLRFEELPDLFNP